MKWSGWLLESIQEPTSQQKRSHMLMRQKKSKPSASLLTTLIWKLLLGGMGILDNKKRKAYDFKVINDYYSNINSFISFHVHASQNKTSLGYLLGKKDPVSPWRPWWSPWSPGRCFGVQVERVVKLSKAMAMEKAKATKAKVKLKAPMERGAFIMGILIIPQYRIICGSYIVP